MQEIKKPFTQIPFDNKTSVFLDACFLLALLNHNDTRHYDTMNLYQILRNNKCKLFITDVVASEVINNLMYKLFIADIRYIIDNAQPLNSKANVASILHSFSQKDRKAIKCQWKPYIDNINYKFYFNTISKSPKKRNLLQIYLNTALQTYEQLEISMQLKYISLSKRTFDDAKVYMKNDLLLVNDAYHLSSALLGNSNYLATLDGDFRYVNAATSIKLLRI